MEEADKSSRILTLCKSSHLATSSTFSCEKEVSKGLSVSWKEILSARICSPANLPATKPHKLVYSNATDTMSESHLLAPPQEPSRNYRSHSLKTQSQPFLFPPRTKRRTLSLPSTKPIIPPFIVISDYQGNNISEREDGELGCEYHKECMAWYTPVLGFSCSVLIYFCSCALAYYSKAS